MEFSDPSLADTVSAASRRLGIGRSSLYLELKQGRISAVKVGRRTLIVRAEQDRWLASLPKAYVENGHQSLTPNSPFAAGAANPQRRGT